MSERERALDSVVAAANKALESADHHLEAKLSSVTAGVNVPSLT